ncbi:hypothetical protein SAMN02745130_03741 [Thiothrix eikelboomii]|uniref:Sulfatase-modifying factor enzyme domain-containing protein n=1 Tax=Thiothrix eikelboomii TaxID=92487 RepID=A0A1T4Y0D6_9GAMM|nr:hypothetical protein [Thiothrix eikelboomii]SKA95259.1 hypothetical protein SAMN02745130_03741 [Thiothrix eikelboomii]
MKQSLLTALCLASVVGCVPPNAVSMGQEQMPTGQSQTVAAKSALRVVGNTIYFLNAPPDKVKPKDFKDQKAIDAHYTVLSAALKKRNPTQDARFAFGKGMRYFFTSNGRNAAGGRGNPFGFGAPEMVKHCPSAHSQFKFIEGYKFGEYSGECLADSRPCRDYIISTDTYMLSWNKEMARLCHGGK